MECRTWSEPRSRFCCSRRHAHPFWRKVWDVRKMASIQANLTVSIAENFTAKVIRGWMGAAVATRVFRLVLPTGKTGRLITRSSETIARRSMPLLPMRVLDGKPGCGRRVSKPSLPVRRLPPQALAISDPTASNSATPAAKLHSEISAVTGCCLVKCRTQSFIATSRLWLEDSSGQWSCIAARDCVCMWTQRATRRWFHRRHGDSGQPAQHKTCAGEVGIKFHAVAPEKSLSACLIGPPAVSRNCNANRQ
jgi:hypothetical protein